MDNGGSGGQTFGGNNNTQNDNSSGNTGGVFSGGGNFSGAGVSIGGANDDAQLYTNYDHLDHQNKNEDGYVGDEVDDENPHTEF